VKLLLVMAHGSPWSLDIATSLHSRGVDVHVLGFEALSADDSPTDLQDLKAALGTCCSVTLLHRSRFGWAQELELARAMRTLALRVRPDIMLCLYGGRHACAALLSGVRPYVVYVVGSDVLLADAALRAINRVALGAAAHVFANGAYLAEVARQQAPAAIVENLLIGVDSEQFAIRARSGPARVFNHRWFAPVYNNEAIIRALALLPTDLPPFEVTFASAGVGLASARSLADRIIPQHVRGEVKFLEGRLRRHELIDELARSDVFVSMARSDGTSTSVLEAMMCGAYSLLSDIPANRALLDRPGIGSLIGTDDVVALAGELARCIRQVEVYRTGAERIRRHAMRIASAATTRASLTQRLTEIAYSKRPSRRLV